MTNLFHSLSISTGRRVRHDIHPISALMALLWQTCGQKGTRGLLYMGQCGCLPLAHLKFCLHVRRITIVTLFVTRVSLYERSPCPTSCNPFNGDHITPTNNTDSGIACVCLNKSSVDTWGCGGGADLRMYALSTFSRQSKWRKLVNNSWPVCQQ